MKKILLVLSIIFSFVSELSANETWIRPVRNDKKEKTFEVPIRGNSSRKIKLWPGEWFKVVDKNNGDIILGTDTLESDALNITAFANKEELTPERKAVVGISFKIVGKDTLLVHVPQLNGKLPYKVINQSKNEILSESDFSECTITGITKLDSATVLRISPEGHLSTLKELGSVEGWNEEPETETCVEESKPSFWSKWWVLSIIVLLALGIIAFLMKYFEIPPFKKVNKTNDLPDDHQQDGESEEQENQTDNSNDANDLSEDEYTRSNTDKQNNIEQNAEPDWRAKAKEYKQKYNNLVKKYNEALYETDKLIESKDNSISTLTRERDALKSKQDKVKKEVQAEAEKKIEDVKQKAQKDIEKAQSEKRKAEEKTKKISDELNAKFDAERADLKSKIKDTKERLEVKSNELSETKSILATTNSNLIVARTKISDLERAQEIYTKVLAFVPYAKKYSALVGELIEISNKTILNATKLLELKLDDPYHIMKFISRYQKALSNIDMETLVTEINMINKSEMVLRGSTLATYDAQGNPDDLSKSVRLYFFDNYTSKLLNALVVFNESLAAADKLVEGVSPSDVKVFTEIRKQLEDIEKQLGVVVEYVKLFDKVGQKLDLRAAVVDAGFKMGDIIDVENAIVYLQGSRRPDTKINVTAQS